MAGMAIPRPLRATPISSRPSPWIKPIAPPAQIEDGEGAPSEGRRQARTPVEAGNFIRNLETPRTGFDAFLDETIARSGTRELSGKNSRGFVYRRGPLAGRTKEDARAIAKERYMKLSPEERARYERAATGEDVMSAGERDRQRLHYAARGVAAMGGASAGETSAPRTGVTPREIRVDVTPAPQALQPQEARDLGTINGQPTEEWRQESRALKTGDLQGASGVQGAGSVQGASMEKVGPPRPEDTPLPVGKGFSPKETTLEDEDHIGDVNEMAAAGFSPKEITLEDEEMKRKKLTAQR